MKSPWRADRVVCRKAEPVTRARAARQRGFVFPWGLLMNPTVLLGIALAAASGFGWLQTTRLGAAQDRLGAVQARFEAFKATVKAEGRLAQERAEAQAKADKLKKEKADANHKAARALDAQRIASLRYDREHSGAYSVPGTCPSTTGADIAAFKRPEFERAISEFVEGAAGIVEECDGIRAALDAAKAWAVGR